MYYVNNLSVQIYFFSNSKETDKYLQETMQLRHLEGKISLRNTREILMERKEPEEHVFFRWFIILVITLIFPFIHRWSCTSLKGGELSSATAIANECPAPTLLSVVISADALRIYGLNMIDLSLMFSASIFK